jgi:hypothetical protein
MMASSLMNLQSVDNDHSNYRSPDLVPPCKLLLPRLRKREADFNLYDPLNHLYDGLEECLMLRWESVSEIEILGPHDCTCLYPSDVRRLSHIGVDVEWDGKVSDEYS